mgnify:CR=1 FL=1
MSDSRGGNHIGLRITEDEGGGGILQNLFHLDDDVPALGRIEFAGQLIGERIISRVAVAGTVLRVGAVQDCTCSDRSWKVRRSHNRGTAGEPGRQG